MRYGRKECDVRRLPLLRSLLVMWCDLNVRLARRWKWSRCPWGLGERASIGMLAGAAWRCGWYALPEYPDAGYSGSGTRRDRLDLLLQAPSASYVVEAKLGRWSAGIRAHSPAAKGARVFAEMESDLRRRAAASDNRLAVVIAVPSVPQGEAEHLGERIDDWLDDLGHLRADARCWFFPEEAAGMVAGSDGHIHPGAALLLRRV